MRNFLFRWISAAVILAAAFLGATAAQAQGVSPNQMFGCNQSAKYDANTNGATRMVVGNAAKGIYVCGWNVMPAGTVSVQFVYGTQTTNPCDTGQTPITPAFQLTAQVPEIDHLPVYTGVTPVPVGKDVCILTNGAVAVQAILYFTQF